MDIIIILTITVLVALYIALPFFLRKEDHINKALESSGAVNEDPIAENLIKLNNEKETLYSAIKDIDFDYGLGKLSKQDYRELDNKYRMEAASVLKEIDEYQKLLKQGGIQTLDQELEQEILSYRKSNDSSDINIEEEISAFRAASHSSIKNSCFQCEAESDLEDAYCSKCGAKLK